MGVHGYKNTGARSEAKDDEAGIWFNVDGFSIGRPLYSTILQNWLSFIVLLYKFIYSKYRLNILLNDIQLEVLRLRVRSPVVAADPYILSV